MNPFTRKRALCLVLTLAPAFAGAQTPEPYSVAGISAFALSNPPRGALAQYYTAGTGAALEFAMPLDAGTASVTAARVPYRGKSAAYNNFTATEALFGWSLMLPLHSRLSVGAGVHAGEFMMAFDDDVINPGLRNEKELLLGVKAAGAFRIAGPLALAAQASYDHVYLHVPTHFLAVQAGLRYTATLPQWLREFMQ
jgi:hypothetical protein